MVEVKQCDREAAADITLLAWDEPALAHAIRSGRLDSAASIHHMARHRAASEAPHLARIAALEAENARLREGDGYDLLLLRAMLCLSGFMGEGIRVREFEEPDSVYLDIALSLGMEDADDEDLRYHIAIEERRVLAAPQRTEEA